MEHHIAEDHLHQLVFRELEGGREMGRVWAGGGGRRVRDGESAHQMCCEVPSSRADDLHELHGSGLGPAMGNLLSAPWRQSDTITSYYGCGLLPWQLTLPFTPSQWQELSEDGVHEPGAEHDLGQGERHTHHGAPSLCTASAHLTGSLEGVPGHPREDPQHTGHVRQGGPQHLQEVAQPQQQMHLEVPLDMGEVENSQRGREGGRSLGH